MIAPQQCARGAATVETGSAQMIEPLAAEWRRLCDEASNNEPFYRPEWVRSYVEAFVPDAKLAIVCAREGDRLTGILPLVEERAWFCGLPVRRLRSASNVHSCRFDLLRAGGPDGDRAVAAIWDALSRYRAWEIVQLADVPEDGALPALVELAAADGYRQGRWNSKNSPFVPLAGTAESRPWLAQTKKKFRKDMERARRRLGEFGEPAYSHLGTADPVWLQAFYECERSGWKGASGSAIACSTSTRHFYDEIARSGEEFGYLALESIECGGGLVCASYNLQYRGRLYALKLAVNEQFRRCAPGHLMTEALLQHCVERGVAVFDFTGPCREFESQWTSTTRPHFWHWIFRDSLYGRLLYWSKFTLRRRLSDTAGRLRRAAIAAGRSVAGEREHGG